MDQKEIHLGLDPHIPGVCLEARHRRIEQSRNLSLLLSLTCSSASEQLCALRKEGLSAESSLDLVMELIPDRKARLALLLALCSPVDRNLPRLRYLMERHGICPLNYIFERPEPRRIQLLLDRMGLSFAYGSWVGPDHELNLSFRFQPDLRTLPEGLQVAADLRLEGCPNLVDLGRGLAVGAVQILGCSGLEQLPDDLQCSSLVLERLPGLRTIPSTLSIRGDLSICGCPNLIALPDDLWVGGYLLVRDCPSLSTLGARSRVHGLTKVKDCPGLREAQETISAQDGWRDFPWAPMWGRPERP